MFPRFLTSIVSWRSVAVLALIASLLQITNIVLSWQLKQRHLLYASETAKVEESSSWPGSKGQHTSAARHRDFHLGPKISDDHQAILSRIAHWSVLDSSGEFRVSVGVLQGAGGSLEWVEQGEASGHHGITLVTQCSLARLHRLPPLTVQWQGPVSIAVFVLSGEVQAAVQTFYLLRKCYPSVKENVTFSLVFPLNSPTSPHIIPTTDTTPCHKIFSALHQDNYSFNGVQYPNNLLRNIARKATTTSHMMVVDIDMNPNAGLQQSFVSFAKKNGLFEEKSSEEKTVWVLPAYEVKEGAGIPQTKQHLLDMKESGLARPFYQELCLKCQRFTDYPAWEKKTAGRDEVMTIYEVLWQDPWEPFYIASTKIPLYDERFRQYGFNRISQVCELHVAGYRFLVLDSAFVIHEGFKTVDSFHSTKDAEQEKNRILFRQFKAELKMKYPESSRRCY